jgi:hypothetical protein
MRKSLAWTLAATAALSAWALWAPKDDGIVGARVASSNGAADRVGPARPVAREGAAPVTVDASRSPPAATDAWPARWPRASLDVPDRNPFVPPAPPAPPPPPVPKPVVAPPAPPSPPAMTYRFLGRMTGPDGQVSIYLANGDQQPPVAVQVGSRLGDGLVVEQITAQGIVFVQTATQQRVTLALPPDAP